MKRPHTETWAGLRDSEVLSWSHPGRGCWGVGLGDGSLGKEKVGTGESEVSSSAHTKKVGYSSYRPGTVKARPADPGDTRGTSSRAELSDLAFQRETSSRLLCCCGCCGETLTKSKLGVNHRGKDLTQKGHTMPTTDLLQGCGRLGVLFVSLPVGCSVKLSGRRNLS